MSLAILGGNMVGEGEGADQLRAELLSGECIPALAKNLYTEVNLEQTGQSFLARTTAGSASVRSGASMLKKLYGAVSRTQQKVSEVLADETTNVYGAFGLITIDDEHESIRVGELGQMPWEFTYNGSGWEFNGIETEMSHLGIDTYYTKPINGDIFKVTGYKQIEYISASRFSTTLNKATFRSKANQSVSKGSTYNFTFFCNGFVWTYGEEEVNLTDYGIVVTPVEGTDIPYGSTISVSYTRESNGKLEFAAPTALKALGLNSCNCFDPNSMVLPNRTINGSGAIVAQQGSYVCYAKAVYNANNVNGYAVYDKNASVTRVGWVATLPTTSTTGITLGNANAQLSHVTFAQNGYIVVACTNVDGLCIHPSWSGMEDRTYTAYSESVFNIPTTDVREAPLQGIGWAVGSYRNTFDFSAKTYTQYVTREAYSVAAFMRLRMQHPTWVEDVDYSYDNDWIYSRATVSYIPSNLPATADGIYYCNDYSTEEFVGTNVAPLADFVYGQNLSDKLRSDVLTRSQAVAMVVTFDDETTATYNVLTNPL